MASAPVAKLSSDSLHALGAVTSGTNSFAFQLYRVLSKENPDSNVITSPLSLQIVMALAYSGAAGETAEEIASALKIPKDMKTMFEGYHSLLNVLKNPVLNLATKMFIEKSFNIKEDFNKNAVTYFESDAKQLNFQSDSNGAKDFINNWVEEKTNKKIKDLIGEGMLTPDTVMVLVNAIHFKANWKTPFSVNSTRPKNFYLNEKDTVEIPMMFKSADFGYTENKELDSKILELPYEGNEFNMYIILPNKITGLAAVEEAISKMNINDVLKNIYSTKVDVTLPKFEITQMIDLNDVLKTLGAKTMFDPSKADFSGISSYPTVVSKVFQKAFIQVDEKGTEAAAATGVRMVRCCAVMPREIVTFIADHPFLFIIKQNAITLQSASEQKGFRFGVFVFIGKFNGKED